MSELIRSVSIEALIAEHDRIANFIKKTHEEFFNIDKSSKFLDMNKVAFGNDRYRHTSFLYSDCNGKNIGLGQALNRVKAQAWGYLMDESGMKTFMGSDQIDKWDEQIREQRYHKDLPELTKENIEATFQTLHSNKKYTFNTSVVSVFRDLSWDYKTNLPQKFGKRIILPYIRSKKTVDKINDLEKAFMVLEEKEPTDYRQAFGTVIYYENFMQFVPKEFECDYMTAKTFKKGTCHILFKRPDLVERLNKIIAVAYPNCLPSVH